MTTTSLRRLELNDMIWEKTNVKIMIVDGTDQFISGRQSTKIVEQWKS